MWSTKSIRDSCWAMAASLPPVTRSTSLTEWKLVDGQLSAVAIHRLWTHNRQRTLPIVIGSLTYVGSEIRIAPGGSIPSRCIVGIGSVITGELSGEEQLIAGVPAKVIKELSEEDKFLIERKTRLDLPDDI